MVLLGVVPCRIPYISDQQVKGVYAESVVWWFRPDLPSIPYKNSFWWGLKGHQSQNDPYFLGYPYTLGQLQMGMCLRGCQKWKKGVFPCIAYHTTSPPLHFLGLPYVATSPTLCEGLVSRFFFFFGGGGLKGRPNDPIAGHPFKPQLGSSSRQAGQEPLRRRPAAAAAGSPGPRGKPGEPGKPKAKAHGSVAGEGAPPLTWLS